MHTHLYGNACLVVCAKGIKYITMQEHEQALLEAISRLGEISDGESGMTIPKHSCNFFSLYYHISAFQLENLTWWSFSIYQKRNSIILFKVLSSYQVRKVYLFGLGGLFKFEVKLNLSPEAQYLTPMI